jgi:protein SCO1
MLAFVVLLSLAVGACRPVPPSFHAADITGSALKGGFALQDAQGRTRRLNDFTGQVVVLFFGYAQCPDVCPGTLQTLATVMNNLGKDAARVQVLFVTVDPERDTPVLLAQYVPQFHPSFIGLTGTPAQIKQVADNMRVFYQKVPGTNTMTYTFDHTAGAYVFDPQGRLRLLSRYGETPENLTADLQALLKTP